MVTIREHLAPVNEYSRCGQKLKDVKGVVMHYTASPGAPAINIAKYFANAPSHKRYASAHYSVDDKEAVRSIPDNEMAYHVGSRTYTKEALNKLGSYPNNNTIGIEMCIDEDGNITEATFQNAADVAAAVLKTHGLNETHLWTHKGVVGWKDCPMPWVKRPSEFDRFKREVAKRLRPQPNPEPKPPSSTDGMTPLAGTVTILVDALNLREGAGTQYKVIRTLKKGEKYHVHGIKNGWYNLGGNQWVSADEDYVEFRDGNGMKVMSGVITILADALNLRAGAGTNYKVIRTLKRGESYKVHGELNGFYHLGGGQWCSADADYVRYKKG